MSINSINNNGTTPINITDSQKPSQVNGKGASAAAPVSSPAPVSSGDTLSLTGTASQLRSLEKSLASLPVVDVQRVDSVKREIANGNYEIDAPRIADKMIQMESALNQRLI